MEVDPPYVKKSTFNFCPHAIKVQKACSSLLPEVMEFKSDGMWRCSLAGSRKLDFVLGVHTQTSGTFKLEAPPMELPTDVPLVIFVSMVVGDAIEHTTQSEVYNLLFPNRDTTKALEYPLAIVGPGTGPGECSRDLKGQPDVSFVLKQYIPGSKHGGGVHLF